jgi:hypothetical protein
VSLLANGNENALGFSIEFSPALLTYAGVTLGGGAPDATLMLNAGQADNGKLGIALSLPAGNSFSPGVQVVALVSFHVAVATNATVAGINFGDAPIGRQLSDAPGNALPATYLGGSVSIPAADFEGDTSPRPDGNKAVTITDWVLLGRYAARLDYPTNASEFQRSDCAPRFTLGDGAITVIDWVQAGRYAAGLDPLTAAGGPTAGSGGSGGFARPKDGSTRRVLVGSAKFLAGQNGTTSVILESKGDESGLGFSLSFDPAVLSFTGATLGSSAAGATLNVNALQAASGKLGIALVLGAGNTFAAGNSEIVKLNFRALAPSQSGSAISLTDQPVTREVSDSLARPLAADYASGLIIVNPLPSLEIIRTADAISLFWPVWATNFTLQTIEGDLQPSATWSNVSAPVTVTNNQQTTTLPLTGGSKWYRLFKP